MIFSSSLTPQVTCNGVEGVTNTDGFDVTVFWEQGFGLDGLLDNSTCGYEEDISMTCVDNGAEPSVALFDNIANNFHTYSIYSITYNKNYPMCPNCRFSVIFTHTHKL